MKRFNFVAPIHFETWDYRNPDLKGIGGSETAVVEMSRRLAVRGHPVTVYAPIPGGYARRHEGVLWKGLNAIDPSEEAVWVLSRCPWEVDRDFVGETWIVMQDEDAVWFDSDPWSEERVEKMGRILPLCPEHASRLARNGDHVADKLCLSTNGVRVDVFEEIEVNGAPERQHLTGIYGSSPDRGLVQALLPFWPRVREFQPDANLRVFYGWDNIDKHLARSSEPHYRRYKATFERMKGQPGIAWLGRVGQQRLYEEWLRAGIWPYWTDFFETSCIASMEAQAGGAIPITRPIGALASNVRFGVLEDGWAWQDSRTICSLVAHTAKFMQRSQDGELDDYRRAMMLWSRWAFDWERVVDQYECWAEGYGMSLDDTTPTPLPPPWLVFQRDEARGTVLNVGAGGDCAHLKAEVGAYNVDVSETDIVSGFPNEIDAIVDGRMLRQHFADDSFDTVILGEVIEHGFRADAVHMVKQALAVARERVVITVPQDGRTTKEQLADRDNKVEVYPGGLFTTHQSFWTQAELEKEFGTPMVYRRFRTPHGIGHGIVLDARRPT